VKGNTLRALLDRHGLTAQVTSLIPDSQPHRALWDTTGTALLLPVLSNCQELWIASTGLRPGSDLIG
jgi:hypothetical protein